ncbi:MAG: hypothetical protein GY806_10570 [Gammaproteobacteria bacterium]|nr:hypothetical protein [Gammaproteobacteria bacterium]
MPELESTSNWIVLFTEPKDLRASLIANACRWTGKGDHFAGYNRALCTGTEQWHR